MINRKVKEIVLPIHPNAPMHDYWIALKVARVGKIVYLNSSEVLYRQHFKNEIGAKIVEYSYFFSKLKNLKETINVQLSIYPLLKDIGYGSIVKYYWFKMKYFVIRNI
jgi:hypothetical protein